MQPSWFDPGHATPADHAACRQLIRDGSRTFHLASLLLPQRVRDPALSLYAFCRLADDAVDEEGDPHAALLLVADRLDRVYVGRPGPHPADRAFADVVADFAIPRALPEALLEGFAWDAEGRHYETFDQLVAYAVRVAGTVGAMMAVLMGVRAPDALARAIDLGAAMQLTNIARDVGDDARRGRLYLPRAWMREAGLDPDAWLAEPHSGLALASVVHRLLDAAALLYKRADGGIPLLPAGCRGAITAAARLYAEIGYEVARNGLDPVTRRAVVPSSRKGTVLARALLEAAQLRPGAPAAPLDAGQFLVEAVIASPSPKPAGVGPGVSGRALWVLDLFSRLEHRTASEG